MENTSLRDLALRIKACVLTVIAWALGQRGAFDLQGRWHRFARWKEARLALYLTLVGEPWEPGPTVRWQDRRYRGDIALPRRKIALEVYSHEEGQKLTSARAMAFHAAGWRSRVVHGVDDVAAILRERQ